MYWNGFRVSAEVIMGEIHVTLRARRFDDSSGAAWDDLYRGVASVDWGLDPLDQIFHCLSSVIDDLAFMSATDRSPQNGSHRLRAPAITG